MDNRVYIYEKDKNAIAFLKGYFKSRKKKYSPTFFTRIADLKKKLKTTAPSALIVGAPGCIDKAVKIAGKTPVMAIVSKSLPDSMRAIINSNIEHYIIPPFNDFDLGCKLQILSNQSDRVEILSQENQDLESIAALSEQLSTTLDPEEVLYLIVKKLSELIPVSRCSVISVNSETDKTMEVIASFESKKIPALALDMKKYPEIRKAIKTKKTVTITDASKDPIMRTVRKTIAPLEIKSIMVIPVLFRSEIIGTLFLRTSRKSYSFTEREKKICNRIANSAAKALNNAYIFQDMSSQRAKMEQMAITDYLTGIYNIRYLYHRLESEFASARRYKTPLSCIMMDIDHFKRVNDTYGHRVGDKVLREFSDVVSRFIRKSDVFARYGGEEFILLLPHSNLVGAIAEAKRLGGEVKNHKFSNLKKGYKITISLGVATYPYHGKIKTQDDLIRLADDALMHAKQSGRDQVYVFE